MDVTHHKIATDVKRTVAGVINVPCEEAGRVRVCFHGNRGRQSHRFAAGKLIQFNNSLYKGGGRIHSEN